MTENNEAEVAVTTEITDDKVNEFFDNGGKFDEEFVEAPKPEVKVEEEKKVNLGALHEERQRRKEEQAARKAAEERIAEYEKRLAAYESSKQEPSYDDDPLEAIKRENDQIKGFLNAQAQAAIQQKQNQAYWARVTESEKAFKQDVPDFDDAVQFLAQAELEEYLDAGFTEVEARKVIADKVKWIADKAYADEVNPAERFYNLAKRRGYKAAEKVDPAMKAIEDKLTNIEKGIKTNRQLPPASKSVNKDLTAEDLAAMNVDVTNPDAFNSAWEKLYGKG